MNTYKIVLLPGDGIGPEITDAALAPIEKAVAAAGGLGLEFARHDAGAERHRRCGVALPDETLADCLAADAVWLAAIGMPDVRKADGTEVQPEMMMGLRRAMGLHSAARPAKLYPGVPTPLANPGAGIDLVIVRENLEGLFASYGGGAVVGDEVATDTIVVTRTGTSKVVDFACRLSRRRGGRPTDARRRVTCVDKANVFRSFAFFRKVFFDVAKGYPDLMADAAYVDAMCLYLVSRPDAYDVLVMENQFGDILSDLAAGLVGGLGMGPSGEIGAGRALFQPAHGSAPDIAGQGIANPAAMILSGAMMLEWLAAERGDPSASRAAVLLDDAVARAVADPRNHPRDLGGAASTARFAEAVADQIDG
ncbi:isocitrate/isopropylmalate dehydrogenase family protein [Botrimarina hoheduenensis]|uniref:3-isopropylmalate dehydrogenase n=1 Tax=Botrimarina hoheduenensis TaxID=2528000 RepID=A0A5C5VWP8_9BACT|nr:isocitrate/isopropylmalate dehydrogenase family protein [Botrimarina hoheduenensis]TWT43106.1 3-isopropylmalate dehydrogenase [Botrimarina hoheduenensis]